MTMTTANGNRIQSKTFDITPNGFAYCKMIYEKAKAVDFVILEANKAFHN